MLNYDDATNKNGLLGELERLVSAAEDGDFSFLLNPDGLLPEESEAILLMKKAISKYRSILEYDIMRYKLTCKSMGMVMWDMDVVDDDPLNPQNQITWSQELRHALGFTDENDFPNVLASWIDLLHPEDKERAINFCVDHILNRNGNETADLEFRLMNKNGEYRHFLSFWAILRDREGKPLREAGSWVDITEQKQVKEKLERRKIMMDTLNETSVILISRSEDTFEENMATGIAPIADIADVDRISVWLNTRQTDGLHASMVYRWDRKSGGTTDPTERFADVKYTEFAPNWIKLFEKKSTVNGPARLMMDYEAAVLKQFGVVSVLVVPVFIKNVFWGFVFFEDRQNERYFDEDCADMLRHAAFLLVNATMRVETERKIAEVESRAKLMLDSSPMCCQLWDRDLNTIDCNEAAVRLYGFKDKQEYIERFIYDCSPEYQPDGQRSNEKAASVVKKAFEEGSYVFDWVHNIPSDGSLMPAEITLIRVDYNGDYAVIGYTRDLREHNKMMEDIEYRDSLLQAVNQAAGFLLRSDLESFQKDLSESMRILAKAVRVDRVHVWKNDRINGKLYCSQLYEFSESALQHGAELTANVSYDEALSGWEELLSNGNCINNIVRKMSPKEQAQLYPQGIVSLLVLPVFVRERFWGFVGFDDCKRERIFTETEESLMRSGSLLISNALFRYRMFVNIRDTSAQLESALKTANAANNAKSAFLANMSHEIRTPMNSIMGFAELARDDDISDRTKNYLLKISENADWLLHIINDILDISKIESGKIIMERLPFDLHEIFDHCRSMIMPKVEEKGLSLYCYAEPSVGKRLIGDPVRICQIIINLLSNAVKFTNVGTIKLLASITSSNETTAKINFEIKDSGIGMNPEQIARIFEPFVQADDSIARKYSGTGLGLTITKNFVELMGGELKVTSAIGVGSKFSFEIPFDLIDVPADDIPKEIISRQMKKPVFEAEILVCEDNNMNQQVICEYLARVGIKAVLANNGQEGIDIFSERLKNGGKPFDLIFMDIHMPIMDGLEAASKISAMGTNTPIVALTANIMINDLELYKTSGMTEYLGKPFTSQDLCRCLMKYFTPLNFSVTDEYQQDADDEKLMNILKINFVKSNQTTFSDIKQAISEDDIELAHRLAHTLKGNAGNINEKKLQEAAAVAESMLKEKKNLLTDEQSNILEAELNLVLEKYSSMIVKDNTENIVKIVDKEKIRELLEKLQPMIADQNVECIDMLGEIRAISGAEELVRQIEDFEFEEALLTLKTLKKFNEERQNNEY